jgi:hypothetical protein
MVGDGLWGQKDGDNYIIPLVFNLNPGQQRLSQKKISTAKDSS